MRKLETQIRYAKDEIEALRALGGNQATISKYKAKITRYLAEYDKITTATGIDGDVEWKRRMVKFARSGSGVSGTAEGGKSLIMPITEKTIRIPQVPSSTITRKIELGEYSTQLSEQQYRKHVEGTTQYKQYLSARVAKGGNPQSILTISQQEAQEIIKRKAGTGIVKVDKKGNPKPQEKISCDKIIGKYYGGGEYHDTSKATIHYSKKGAHIVPTTGDDYD